MTASLPWLILLFEHKAFSWKVSECTKGNLVSPVVMHYLCLQLCFLEYNMAHLNNAKYALTHYKM